MRSIKTLIIVAMLSCTILSVMIVGFISIKTANDILNSNSSTYLELICQDSADDLEDMFGGIENSVALLSRYTVLSLEQYGYERFKSSRENVVEYADSILPMFESFADTTSGLMSVYLHFNPELTYPTAGIFILQNDSTGIFEPAEPLDLSAYGPDDHNHADWYYIPAKTGKPAWILPYQHLGVNKMTMSYVVPIYFEDELLGVAGMDVSYNEIAQIVNDISIYSTGYAFLLDENDRIIVHRTLEMYTHVGRVDANLVRMLIETGERGVKGRKYIYDGVEKSMSATRLSNGMTLVLAAPVSEILRDSTELSMKIIAVAIISGITVIIVTAILATRLLKPASIDALTGLANRFAFTHTVKERLSAARSSYFALVMLDIDRFKSVNDTYGHATGDDALRQTAYYLNYIFSPEHLVARFGGDEFLIFLQDVDRNTVMNMLDRFMGLMALGGELYKNKLTCSMGVVYSTGHKEGTDPEKLIKRADDALYTAKFQGRNRYVFRDESGVKERASRR